MLNPCPMCKGRQPNNPKVRVISGPCDYCGGLGELDDTQVCKCGRPAVRKVENAKVCTRHVCAAEVLEAKKLLEQHA